MNETENHETSELAEYVIHARLKNNLLLSRILAAGKNVAQFCKNYNIPTSSVGDLINMKDSALKQDLSWREIALNLSEILNVPPEELFSEEQRTLQLKTNKAEIYFTTKQLEYMGDPLKALENKELLDHLVNSTKLSSKEKLVIKLRFIHEYSLVEVGEALGVTRERIRQIEYKVLRKLRRTASKTNALGITSGEATV